ncbi:MAG: ComEC/Rec2 family competence protein [Planctomycetota bacterium]|jgi:competence protein ComEC
MIRAFCHRPLALAGLSAVAATLVTAQFDVQLDAQYDALGDWPGSVRIAGALGLALAIGATLRALAATNNALLVTLLVGAAAVAGTESGNRLRVQQVRAEAARQAWVEEPHSSRAGTSRARAPPAVTSVDLTVVNAGQDPWTERAWVVGERADGVRLSCNWPGSLPPWVGVGARVRATGRLDFPRRVSNPGGHDHARAMARDGIAARLYLKEGRNLECMSAGGSSGLRVIRSARWESARRLRAALPPADAAVATALLLGWRSGLSERDRLRFERTGTMHLLAISGLHLLLVAGLVHLVARRVGAGPRLAAACALALALAYVPYAGAGAPVRRAAAVLATYGIALARGRVPDSASALGGAALLLTLADPAELFRLGFWLSFVAAVAIAWLAHGWAAEWGARNRMLARFPAVQADRPWRLRFWSYVWRTLPVAVAAGCATQPLIAWHFGLVTPWSPLTNLLAAPFVTLLMPMFAVVAAGGDLVAPVGPAICTALLHALRLVLDACDALPGACIPVTRPHPIAIAVWFGGLTVLTAWPRTGLALLVCALACAWPGGALAQPFRALGSPTTRAPEFWLLDVGHGQAALLRDADGRVVLVDGGSRNRRRIGRTAILPALRHLGIARVDLCVCTHDDADHWRGLLPLFGRIRIGAVAVGVDPPQALLAHARRSRVPIRRVLAGGVIWRGREASLRAVDAGAADPQAHANDRSLVLVAEIGPHSIFLPADRETAGLRSLVDRGLSPCAVMLAPHHGAALPDPRTARAVGRLVAPRWLLVSSARGFADAETLAAFGALRTWSTARHGALCMTLLADGSLQLRPVGGRGATIAPP